MDADALKEEIRAALRKSGKGLTARQLHGECESSGDLNEIVKVIHDLKGEGVVRADGMKDSQVLYKLGAGKVADGPAPSDPAPNLTPARLAPGTPERMQRSVAGLREGLFSMLDKIAAGKVENATAKTYAHTAMTIVKSLEVQLEFERMRIAKEIPISLDEIALVPMLEKS